MKIFLSKFIDRFAFLSVALFVSAQLVLVAPAFAKSDPITPALVVDMGSLDVLYAQAAGRPWYPASTAKLMNAFVVFEAIEAGEVSLDTPVVMSRTAMKQEDSHAGLSLGSAMTLKDALYAAYAGSANEVAEAIAETVAGSRTAFVARMNAAAKRLGLSASHFANPNGLFNRSQYMSARDLAILAILVNQRFSQYSPIFQTSRVVVDGHNVDSYNQLLTRFPGATGMKTGFLCSAGRNIVAVAHRNQRNIMVVLFGATTGRERSERAAKLLTEAFSGQLQPTGQSIIQVVNHPDQKPEDMRMRLCSNQSAPYEKRRNALYPMGLGGNKTYLSPASPRKVHTITTWKVAVPEPEPKSTLISGPVPIPAPRPKD